MMLIISYTLCFIYVVIISIFFVGWIRTKKKRKNDLQDYATAFISVIIPFRNESKNLPSLLDSLISQTYNKFEILLIDDHSTDNSISIIEQYADKINIKVIKAVGDGKKNALREGISNSSGELIVCTDADCIANNKWLESIANFYAETTSDLIIAPVMMLPNTSPFEQMQALEFLSLQASTAGAACSGMPIMCNGANLAFTRKAWDENNAYLNDEKLSGDDMFLMLNIKKYDGKISYLKSTDALIFTHPCKTFSEFLNQRKRWVSKSTLYKDTFVILSAFSVMGISMILILNLFLGLFFHPSYLIVFVSVFFCKLIIDSALLYSFAAFVQSKYLLKWIFPLSLIYPFYITFSVSFGIFGRFEWKGRKEKPTK